MTIRRRRFNSTAALVTFGLIATCSPQVATATSILTYTGNPYTTIVDTNTISGTYETTMFVSATIELASDLGANFDATVTPLHFSVNDGRFTITDLFPSSLFHFTTDAAGAITKWYFEVHESFDSLQGLIIQSAHDLVVFGTVRDTGSILVFSTGEGDAGIVQDSGGRWVVGAVAAVPEPSALTLLVTGLVGLGFRLRKRIS